MKINNFKKILLILLVTVSSLILIYLVIPKKYDTRKPLNSNQQFTIPQTGYLCECLGSKNITDKTCIGFIYSCQIAR